MDIGILKRKRKKFQKLEAKTIKDLASIEEGVRVLEETNSKITKEEKEMSTLVDKLHKVDLDFLELQEESNEMIKSLKSLLKSKRNSNEEDKNENDE